jgi:hypothetical protein
VDVKLGMGTEKALRLALRSGMKSSRKRALDSRNKDCNDCYVGPHASNAWRPAPTIQKSF